MSQADLSVDDKIEMILRLANSWQVPGHHAKFVLRYIANDKVTQFEAEVGSSSSGNFNLIVDVAPTLSELVDKLLAQVAAQVSETIHQRRVSERFAIQHRQDLEANILKIEADIVQRNKT